MINLPYIVTGEGEVVTQSNSCLLYLGKIFGIDSEAAADRNHQALDQIMDLRNDAMKVTTVFYLLPSPVSDLSTSDAATNTMRATVILLLSRKPPFSCIDSGEVFFCV